MDLIFIFDNSTFSNNTTIINCIKRWISYELNNILFKSEIREKINKINFVKTFPSIQNCNINLDTIGVTKVLSIINGIIFKKYYTYPNINFKEIVDYISKIDNPNTKLVLFSSIDNIGMSNANIKYVNDIFDKVQFKINIYNIGKYSCLNTIFPKINEIFINFKNSKLETIISKEHNIFTIEKFNQNNLNIKTINFENLGNTENPDENNNMENNNINKILVLLQNIELYILENEISDENILSQIKNILNISIYNFVKNKSIYCLIKNYINSIDNFLEKKYNKCPIIVPINDIPSNLTETNIKYILDFYQEIYPKFVNYLMELGLKNLKIPKGYITSTLNYDSIQKLPKFDSDSLLDDSKEFLNSNLTMSNWVDEYNEFNPFGILIKYSVSKFSFKGLIDENSTIIKWYPNTIINSVSNNWVSLNDYYQMVLTDLNNIQVNDEDGEHILVSKKELLKINDFLIIDNVNGDTNIVLPIYINKHHWSLTKSIWKYHMAFINNTFEYNYNKKMDNIYYLVLLKNLNMFNEPNKFTNSFIRVFFYNLRTCIELMIENKFINSVSNEVKKIFEIITVINGPNPNVDILRNNSITFVIMVIQWIISSNCNLEQLKNYLAGYRNIVINNYIFENYKIDFWEGIKNKPEEERKNELQILKQEIIQENKSLYDLEIDLVLLGELITKIYKLKGFNQLIKLLDKHNGCIPINSDTFINCNIFKSMFETLENYKTFNINNYLESIDLTYFLNQVEQNKLVEQVDQVDQVNQAEQVDLVNQVVQIYQAN